MLNLSLTNWQKLHLPPHFTTFLLFLPHLRKELFNDSNMSKPIICQNSIRTLNKRSRNQSHILLTPPRISPEPKNSDFS